MGWDYMAKVKALQVPQLPEVAHHPRTHPRPQCPAYASLEDSGQPEGQGGSWLRPLGGADPGGASCWQS